MQAPLKARNDSDAAQTNTARTVAKKPVLADNRAEAVAQSKLAEMMNNSPRVLQQRALSDAIHNSPRMVAQRHQMNALSGGTVKPQGNGAMRAEASLAQREEKTNKTGLPNQLKSGIESLSGMSMNHVKVHYNSDKPAQLQAHAYAQSSEIHLGAGQERHLPHEAWHVVQQAQGRVRPTLQMKAGAVNDDPSLEKEADVMGEKAAQFKVDRDAGNRVAEERVAGVVTHRAAGLSVSVNDNSALEHEVDVIGAVAQTYRNHATIQRAEHRTQAAASRGCYCPGCCSPKQLQRIGGPDSFSASGSLVAQLTKITIRGQDSEGAEKTADGYSGQAEMTGRRMSHWPLIKARLESVPPKLHMPKGDDGKDLAGAVPYTRKWNDCAEPNAFANLLHNYEGAEQSVVTQEWLKGLAFTGNAVDKQGYSLPPCDVCNQWVEDLKIKDGFFPASEITNRNKAAENAIAQAAALAANQRKDMQEAKRKERTDAGETVGKPRASTAARKKEKKAAKSATSNAEASAAKVAASVD